MYVGMRAKLHQPSEYPHAKGSLARQILDFVRLAVYTRRIEMLLYGNAMNRDM